MGCGRVGSTLAHILEDRGYTFAVAQVAARIYDPRRAEVYERLGIPTVATVRWTADQMLRKLLPGSGVVPQIGTVLQEGDVVHVIARESDLDRVMAAFGKRDGSEN